MGTPSGGVRCTICPRSGTTGTSMPSHSAVCCDHGPFATSTAPASMRSPDASVTPHARSPSRSTPFTSAVRIDTPRFSHACASAMANGYASSCFSTVYAAPSASGVSHVPSERTCVSSSHSTSMPISRCQPICACRSRASSSSSAGRRMGMSEKR